MDNGQEEEGQGQGQGQPIETDTPTHREEGDEQDGPLVESLSMATEMDPTEIFALRAAMGGTEQVPRSEGGERDKCRLTDRSTDK